MTGMRKLRPLSFRIGMFSVASLASAILFCFSCSAHEYNHQGQAQDAVTHLLAAGTYLSLIFFVLLGLIFIAVLIAEK